MKAGVIGTVDGDFAVVDSFSNTVTEEERELTRCIDIQRVFSLPTGDTAFAGHAATEEIVERASTEIDYGEIRTVETPQKRTRYTEFVGIPGEFVVVGSGSGTFAFELIGMDTETTIERATLDLDGFLDAHGDGSPWKAGFSGTGGNVQNGVIHGADILQDQALGAVLEEATLNQLGLEHAYGDQTLKMTATSSGYVEVYRPSEFGVSEFLQYVREDVVPHIPHIE